MLIYILHICNIYKYIPDQKWSMTCKMVKSHRSKMSIINTWNHENNMPSSLLPQWLCGRYQQYVTVHHVPKCMGCYKDLVLITGRAHYLGSPPDWMKFLQEVPKWMQVKRWCKTLDSNSKWLLMTSSKTPKKGVPPFFPNHSMRVGGLIREDLSGAHKREMTAFKLILPEFGLGILLFFHCERVFKIKKQSQTWLNMSILLTWKLWSAQHSSKKLQKPGSGGNVIRFHLLFSFGARLNGKFTSFQKGLEQM